MRLYLTVGNGYAEQFLAKTREYAALTAAQAQLISAGLAEEKHLIRQMAMIAGVPPPDLG